LRDPTIRPRPRIKQVEQRRGPAIRFWILAGCSESIIRIPKHVRGPKLIWRYMFITIAARPGLNRGQSGVNGGCMRFKQPSTGLPNKMILQVGKRQSRQRPEVGKTYPSNRLF
jgi:hypothetical protein